MESSSGEVICISSDEDEHIEQTTDKKSIAVIEKLNDNDIHTRETEVTQNKNESKEVQERKRKLPEVNNSNDLNSENRADICEGERNFKICKLDIEEKTETEKESEVEKKPESETKPEPETKPEVEREPEVEKKYIKPKLVVMVKKSISFMEHDVFPMFISLCLQKDRSDDMKKVVSKLKRRYEQLDPEYANSEAFCNLLNTKRDEISNDKKTLYLHIQVVNDEMKAHANRQCTVELNSNCHSNINNINDTNLDAVPSTSRASDNTFTNGNRMSDSDEEDNAGEEDSADEKDNADEEDSADEKDNADQDVVERRIRRLEKAMEECRKHIRNFENAEVDFNDDNNSSYIKEGKFKKRMVQLYNKYCKYTGQNSDADRPLLRPKHFSSTGIVVVDHAITSFINSKILKRKKANTISTFTETLIFPDYYDILKLVQKCNETNNLGLDNRKQKQLAKKAFIEIGDHLQRCRKKDYWDTFSLFLEDKEEDPATKDPALAKQLRESKLNGEKKIADILQEYADKQEKMRNEIVDTKASSEKENEESDDDEGTTEDEDGSEIDVDLSENWSHISTDKEENSVDKTTIESETNIDKEEIDTNVSKAKETKEETCDMLKDDNNSQKPEKIDDSKKMNNCESNSDSKSTVETKEESSSLKTQVSTSFTELLPITTNNDIPIDEAKELKSIVAVDDASEKIMNSEDKPKEAVQENEKEDKPLLRVRSFAKPPTTWEDNHGKMEKKSGNQSVTPIDIVDLTQTSPKEDLTKDSHGKIPVISNVFSSKQGIGKIRMILPVNNNLKVGKTYVARVLKWEPKTLERGEIPQRQIGGKSNAKATIIVNQRKRQINTDIIRPQSDQITSPTTGSSVHSLHHLKSYSEKSQSK